MNIRTFLPWITIAAALITVYLNYLQTREINKLKKLAMGEHDCNCNQNGVVTEQYHAHPIG